MATEICVAAPVYIQTQRCTYSCMDIPVCAHIFHFRTKARQHDCVNALLVFFLLFLRLIVVQGAVPCTYVRNLNPLFPYIHGLQHMNA